ncbi:hypothetical protein BD626DRAFT_392039 [Schizophyllum amplum]|uniref:Uncharacterized protein n=1 Tax=Schizophyllum amplum TaxID=97359 RepID=A0A550CZV1_9AGAR|nr:hypothetical protein BD626DRAFT_392039 [Auriculariopsis ampla]
MAIELPIELHRLVFEICGWSEPHTLPTLVLVSSTVRTWTNPILYSVITLWEQRTADLFVNTLESPTSAHHASLVRNLCLTKAVGHRRALRILTLCPNLDHLACWISHPDLYPVLAAHRPQTLSVSFAPLFRDAKRARPDFGGALFERATHVEFKDDPQTWANWTGFLHAPRLTHLAFSCHLSASTVSAAARAIRGILESCTSLRVCLVLAPSRSHWRQVLDVEDPRVVHLNAPKDLITDWENSVRGYRNIWTLAEEVVARRTCKEVDVRSTNSSTAKFQCTKARRQTRYVPLASAVYYCYNTHIAVTDDAISDRMTV